jgi:filamentous hemagglutinin family protein
MQNYLLALSNGLSLCLSSTIWLCFLPVIPLVQAQSIIPDATLPNNSIVTPHDGNLIITGGTTVGTNLFHSFEKFSVSTGEIAHFNNIPSIKNIITRVTGNSISNIDGLIRTNGNTSLFLLNPNGINFGSNAALNIGGSFFASTADAWITEKSTFSATNTTPIPLLSISTPIGVQWGTNETGNITNSGNLVAGKNLVLAAGNISSTGKLSALDGNLDLIAKGDINIGVANARNINFNNQEKINEVSNFININDTTTNSRIVAQSPTDDTRDNSKIDNYNLLNLPEKQNLPVTEVTVINESTIKSEVTVINESTIKSEVTPTKYSEVNNNLYQRQLLNISSISIVSASVPSISKVNPITQTCPTQLRNNSFIIIGRGGLPTSSKEALNINYGWIDWRITISSDAQKLNNTIQKSLVEATSLQVDANGIKLVAASTQESFNDYSLNNIPINHPMTRYKAEPCNAILGGSASSQTN